MTRRIVEDMGSAYFVIVDVTRALRIDGVAITLLNTARRSCCRRPARALPWFPFRRAAAVVRAGHPLFPPWTRRSSTMPKPARAGRRQRADTTVALEQFDVLAGLDAAKLSQLTRRLRLQQFERGTSADRRQHQRQRAVLPHRRACRYSPCASATAPATASAPWRRGRVRRTGAVRQRPAHRRRDLGQQGHRDGARSRRARRSAGQRPGNPCGAGDGGRRLARRPAAPRQCRDPALSR